MNEDKLWINFTESGSISDYLLYSAAKNDTETGLKNDNS